jgi:hypothetical protein
MSEVNTRFITPWLGCFADESLVGDKVGKVAGVTSKGAFVLFENKSILVTPIRAKSPFNIQLNEGIFPYGKINTGDEVEYSKKELRFTSARIVIDLSAADVWTPLPAKTLTTSNREQADRMDSIITQIKGQVTADLGLLSQMDTAHGVNQRIMGLKQGFRDQDLAGCLNSAAGLIGYGSGLTPSGDDLLAGFLLYHVRLDQATSHERPFVKQLGQALTEQAYLKTTRISANRIEAALRGWSEDIFVGLLDYLYNRLTGLPEGMVKGLLGFGHSSGVDTTLGLSIAAEVA